MRGVFRGTCTPATRSGAKAQVGITRVEPRFDGDGPLATLSAAPYALEWDTSLLPNGLHLLTARATDPTGPESIESTKQNEWCPIVRMRRLGIGGQPSH